MLQAVPLLVPFTFWLAADASGGSGSLPRLASLRVAIAAHLADQGWPAAEPLRWAITAVDPGHGLQLEGVAVSGSPPDGAMPRL
jgi:hypothetical protein